MLKDNLLYGFRHFLTGFRMISSPGLKRFIIVPVIVNIVLLIVITAAIAIYITHHVPAFLLYFPKWVIYILGWLFWLLYGLTSLLIGTFIFTMMTNIIASPFYGILSEKTEEKIIGNYPVTPNTFKELMILWGHTFIRECKKILYFIPWFLLCLVFLIIPMLWPLFPIVWWVVMAWIMAVQYCDYAADNQRIPLKRMLKILKQYPWTSLGFGGSVSVALMIPGLNLVVPAAAVAGGTVLWITLNDDNQGGSVRRRVDKVINPVSSIPDR